MPKPTPRWPRTSSWLHQVPEASPLPKSTLHCRGPIGPDGDALSSCPLRAISPAALTYPAAHTLRVAGTPPLILPSKDGNSVSYVSASVLFPQLEAPAPTLGRELPQLHCLQAASAEILGPPKTVDSQPRSVACFLFPFSSLPQPCLAHSLMGGFRALLVWSPRPPLRPHWDPARPDPQSRLAFVASPRRNKALDFTSFLA